MVNLEVSVEIHSQNKQNKENKDHAVVKI